MGEIGSMRNAECGMRRERSFRTPHWTNGTKSLRILSNRAKKGQFFVITAVAVILVLYGLSDFLKIQSFDATGVQGNALLGIARSVEDNLNKTVVYSPPSSVSKNLDELIALEKDSMKSQGYSLDVKYNITSAPKTATIIILYPGAYYENVIYLG